MANRNCTLLILAITALAVTASQTRAQSVYPTPYAFANFAGLPGVPGTNDGNGSTARFYSPQGVALDSATNLYVADETNGTIRMITPAGLVTTIAGGFNMPTGLAVDSAGNVYVGNTYNHTIDMLTPVGPNWVVTTLAGSAGHSGNVDGFGGAARFNYPTGVAVDSATNLYVADYINAKIRKITPAGLVTTVAGFGGEFQYPDGVAVDSAGNVYVTDEGIQTIQKIAPDGVVTTLAGSVAQCGSADGTNSAALFCQPHGVVVDSATNIYVGDAYANTIRKLTPVGTNWVVTTLAGSAGPCGSDDGNGSAALFCGPNGLALDSAGHVYVADGLNHRITIGTPVTATLTISRQISNIVHHFTPGSEVTDEIIFDRAGLTNIDLSQYRTFELRLFMPAGQRIVVNPPTNFTSTLWVNYLAGDTTSSHVAPPAILSFENFSGVLPTRTSSHFIIGNAGSFLEFDADESYTNRVEFTAMRYAFTPTYNPANTPKNFPEFSYLVIPVSFSYTTSQTNDPGAFVTLAAISPLMAVAQGTQGNVTISWLSKLQERYQVQCATNLLTTNNWINFGSEIIGDGLINSVSDSTTNRPAKYYRIKILP